MIFPTIVLATYNASLQVENDLFGDGYDKHYTNGIRISGEYTYPPDMVCKAREYAKQYKFLDSEVKDIKPEFAFGMNMYTPADITATALQRNDRPYAGWTYVSIGLSQRLGGKISKPLKCDGQKITSENQSVDWQEVRNIALEVGVIGPISQAGKLQKFWHDHVITAPHPSGWHHQLKNEIAFSLYHNRMYRNKLGSNLDSIHHIAAALGTLHTYASAGTTLRFGNGLQNDYGPLRVRPSIPGAGVFNNPNKTLTAYGFVGAEARLVARNIFLDGNTFRDSHSVEKENWVADLQYGFVAHYGNWSFSYTKVARSKEFKSQKHNDQFGSFSVSRRFH